MNYVGKFFSNVKGFYNEINSATLTGAIDVVIIKQEDGTYLSSPWHVRFGKMGVLRAREKLVDIEINGEPVDLHMKLGEGGGAFFVQEAGDTAEVPAHLATSPLLSTLELMEEGISQMKNSVETKAARSRPPSISEDKSIETKTSEHKSKRRKKRRLRKEDIKEPLHDEPLSAESSDFPEEVLFELEMSSEEDDAMVVPGVCHSMSMPIIQEKLARTDEWANTQFASAFHPFSDGDITPIVSPVGSRPPTPKSDTEFENQKYDSQKYDAQAQTQLTGDDMDMVDDVKWAWGELPTSESPVHPPNKAAAEEASSGGLLSFMRKTKKVRHQPEQEGIYLEDLNLDEMDPEVAALYLPAEGLPFLNRPSLMSTRSSCVPPLSNLTWQGQSSAPPFLQSFNVLFFSFFRNVAMSLCGGLKEHLDISAEKFDQALVTYDRFCKDPAVLNDPNLVVKIGDKYYTWEVAGPMMMSVFSFQQPLSEVHQGSEKRELTKEEEEEEEVECAGDDSSDVSDKVIRVSATEPILMTKDEPCAAPNSNTLKINKFQKSLKLSSEDILKLNLKEGKNEASFSVTTQYQGTCRCNCSIYVWKWDDRIIISDIDGTITKSDVLGQVLPMIGKDWSQEGIAGLYNMVYRNGYKFVYLSARAIGQSKITRDYLLSLRQGELALPEGPLLLSPSSLMSAFHKEVIERKPEEFKISCLKNIAALFPESANPFYAGFGNKINDTWAYRAVGIPISRVFTVNHRGELKMEFHTTFQSSYTKLSDIYDHFFPPLLDRVPKENQSKSKVISGNFPAAQEYSTFTYWREPLLDISDELPDFSKSSKGRKISVDVTAASEETDK
ncbi:hypothetical protein CAPTEDRAFT_223314 [Capitella teleta]|uniref:phosphatidate phosphatase n=1 Tax=Capitella teleta TaxID=283909 RepID=R7T7R2_CAPTE|nr:hypothetical protein CAPTEDRAFT_223314 [Capitella teleta]|eukprot:ELT87039.1 hypothetical protein CAPTEDRAFT_223314 [Capitella teleta]